MTYDSLFVIDLASRRVHVAGPTRHPDGAFMRQAARDLTAPIDKFLGGHRVLICDRDRQWSDGFHEMVEQVGLCVVQTPYRAPNGTAHAERFVRSITEECSHRVIPLEERRLRHAIDEFVIHHRPRGGITKGSATS